MLGPEQVQTGPETGNTKPSPKTTQPIKSKRKCFTWNNYPADAIETLKNRFDTLKAKYIFGEEVGEQGTKHLQGYVETTEKTRWTEFKLPKQIHWENARGDKSSNVKYCSKEGIIYTNIKMDKPLKLISEEKFYPWQKNIMEIISKEPDDRSIYWYWEEAGCAGKTQFCKFLVASKGALVVCGKSVDAFHGVVKYREENGYYPDIIIFDVPRTCIDFVSYTAIEKIKDGLFFSGKYESAQVIFNSPHVLVFANQEPVTSSLSKDRWHIFKI